MSQRLFFALWPEAGTRTALESRLDEFTAGLRGGRVQHPGQWHVTLEFLGAVSDERLGDLRAATDDVRAEAFELSFDAVDHWRRAGVLLLAATRTPPALAGLVSGLRAALVSIGFTPESREFRPHVTLARKVAAGHRRSLAQPLRWPAARYALVSSITDPAGSRYEPLHWWNLARRSD